jgi:hypothetical protein
VTRKGKDVGRSYTLTQKMILLSWTELPGNRAQLLGAKLDDNIQEHLLVLSQIFKQELSLIFEEHPLATGISSWYNMGHIPLRMPATIEACDCAQNVMWVLSNLHVQEIGYNGPVYKTFADIEEKEKAVMADNGAQNWTRSADRFVTDSGKAYEGLTFSGVLNDAIGLLVTKEERYVPMALRTWFRRELPTLSMIHRFN